MSLNKVMLIGNFGRAGLQTVENGGRVAYSSVLQQQRRIYRERRKER